MYSLTFREFKSIKDKLKDAVAQYCRSTYDSTCNIGIEARDIKFENFVSDDDQVETISIYEFDNYGKITSQYIPLMYDSIKQYWVGCYSNSVTGLSTIVNNTIKQMRYKNLSDSVGNAVTIREIEELFD